MEEKVPPDPSRRQSGHRASGTLRLCSNVGPRFFGGKQPSRGQPEGGSVELPGCSWGQTDPLNGAKSTDIMNEILILKRH